MGLDNTATLPSDRLLGLIKRRGPMRTSELAQALAISVEAARQQLNRLAREGLVEPEVERGGVGRPSQRWALTSIAEARFPDAHAELTVRLIEAVRAELGEAALDRLVMAHEARARATYLAEMADAGGPAEKIARLAAIRTREGYMAEWDDYDGVFLLTENHCPICAAAQACQGFCRAELELFQEVLGPELEVTRTDHIAAGARRCAYRIVPAEPA
ncbi:MAG TPA: metalloregulator ArsR/SmtB family transcription factor [Caulobacteraceae bacterium]